MLKNIELGIYKKIEQDIDKDIQFFNKNLDEVDKIKTPNLDKITKNTINKVIKDNNEFDKVVIMNILVLFIFIGSILSIYSPALTYKLPPAYKLFKNINKALNIDFIVDTLGIDNFIPKVDINEFGELQIVEESNLTEESQVKYPTNSKEVLNLIHSMANLITVAEHKCGSVEITPKTVDIALNSLSFIKDDIKRNYLRNSLEKWKNGDFSNGIELHNYVWNMLGGSTGIAYSLDDTMIKNITSEYFTK